MAVPEQHLEIERKYDADSDFTLPELNDLPGVSALSEPRTDLLVASYFDTDDFRLARHGITLRRRRGGADAGWHLKIPAGRDGKRELRAKLGRPQTVPAKLAELVAGYTRGAALRQVASLETHRTVVLLLGPGGETLAEVADDAVIGQVIDPAVTGADERAGAPPISTWREIEVELGSGRPDLLKAADKRLRGAGARRGESASKLGRVLAPVLSARLNGHRAEPPAEGTAAAAVVGYLDEHVRAILAYDPKARLAEEDAVHKMRVSVRRIRSALKSHRSVLDRTGTDPLQPELKWLADVLGEVRDLEVLRMRFTDHLAELGDLPTPESGEQSWLAGLAKEEKAAYRRLNAALTQQRYYDLLDALESLVQDPPFAGRADRPAAKEVPRIVKREWRRLADSYAAIDDAPDRDEARHDTRKTAKRTRYAADLAAGALDGKAAKTAAQTASYAKALQETLGGFQDGVIAMERLRAMARHVTDPSERFALGALYGIEHCQAENSLAKVENTWTHASAPSF